jgi:hypothetical protein
MTIKRGDRFVAYPDHRPCQRLYVTITRVAFDQSWADIRVQTWAVMWTKRQPLTDDHRPPATVRQDWTTADLAAQEADHMVMLREEGKIR